MTEAQFSVTITALQDSHASELSSRFLAMVFKNRTLEEISYALKELPLLITSDVSLAAAQTLRRHLEARGATVQVECRSPGGEAETIEDPPSIRRRVMPAPPALESETSYTHTRPGRRDRIYYR